MTGLGRNLRLPGGWGNTWASAVNQATNGSEAYATPISYTRLSAVRLLEVFELIEGFIVGGIDAPLGEHLGEQRGVSGF